MEDYKKKYEEIIKIIKEAKESMGGYTFSSVVDKIIPELKESEDEKIKKEIIRIVDIWTNSSPVVNGIPSETLLAWLEEQGKNNTDKIIERARTEKQRVLLTETNGNAHIDWDCRSLQDVKLLLKYGLEYIDTQFEKQSEQESTDKVKPKFKAGNWYLCVKDFYVKGVRFDKGRAYYCKLDGCLQKFNSDEYIAIDEILYDYFNLWTIQDAKEGDVLTCYSDIKGQPIEQTGIIKQYVGRHGGCSNSFKAHFGVDWDNNVVIEGYMGSSNIYPATKEQRDLLFQKMKEAGYEWDAEKKELKKIEQNPTDKVKPKFKVGDHISNGISEVKIVKINDNSYSVTNDEIENDSNPANWVVYFKDQDNWKLFEQNSKMIQWTGDNLKEIVDFTGKSPMFDKWFKTWEEFEAYVHAHNDIFKLFDENGNHYEIPIGAWIVKTPDGYNVASKAVFKPKSTWSEEDEKMYAATIFALAGFMGNEDKLNWLKSLKERYTWKPSDEQIEAVKCAALDVAEFSQRSDQLRLENDSYYKALISLYEQLKKLKGE